MAYSKKLGSFKLAINEEKYKYDISFLCISKSFFLSKLINATIVKTQNNNNNNNKNETKTVVSLCQRVLLLLFFLLLLKLPISDPWNSEQGMRDDKQCQRHGTTHRYSCYNCP